LKVRETKQNVANARLKGSQILLREVGRKKKKESHKRRENAGVLLDRTAQGGRKKKSKGRENGDEKAEGWKMGE